jgi:peptidyl-dipeptidase Dcp
VTEHEDNVMLNKALFERVKAVYEQRESAGPDHEQFRSRRNIIRISYGTGRIYRKLIRRNFVELNQQLSALDLQFGENLLAETNKNFRLIIDKEEDSKDYLKM